MADAGKKRRIAKFICCSLLCSAVVTIIALLCVYGVRLGTGDEVHAQATLGTCREGTADSTAIKVMTYNTFLIPCVGNAYKCQEESGREARVKELTAWFGGRDEDVILMQELWSFHDQVRDGMAAAGYCNYVMTEHGGRGSGLGIFSKHPGARCR